MKIIFFMIIVLGFISSFVVTNAEELTLKQQLLDNVDWDDIICSNSEHVLAERPNDKIACVYPDTADKLGWHVRLLNTWGVQSTFEVQKNNEFFDINYNLLNGKIQNMVYIEDENSLLVNILPERKGNMTIHLPMDMFFLDGFIPQKLMFVVLIEEEEQPYEIINSDDNNKTINFEFDKNTKQVQIVGAYLI